MSRSRTGETGYENEEIQNPKTELTIIYALFSLLSRQKHYRASIIMSDSEDYEYEYDESDQEAMDAGSNGGGGDDEDASFEYTDDEDNADNNDGGEVALENAYYNAETERDDSLEATVTANNLSVDLLANIFGFLGGVSDI